MARDNNENMDCKGKRATYNNGLANSVSGKGSQDAAVDLQLRSDPHGQLSWSSFLLLSWAAIGVIFGDIATSPLYVYQSIYDELNPDGPPKQADILGITSLVFWTLSLEVLVKYMGVVLRADDQGQGGTFALYSLLCRHIGIKPHGVRGGGGTTAPVSKKLIAEARAVSISSARAQAAHFSRGVPSITGAGAHRTAAVDTATGAAPIAGVGDANDDVDSDSEDDGAAAKEPELWWQRWSVDRERVCGFFRRSRGAQVALWCVSVTATSMLMGDGVLTPAMSVLSAVSGLRVVAPNLGQDVVIGVTIIILVFIFSLQRMGSGMVGRFFAPIIALWLVANAAINAYNLAQYGGYIFNALNPAHIVTLFKDHGAAAWRSLGSVMLCVTGAEALFADLGHFSRGSISVAFGVLAYPCLIITYLGQAAYLLQNPDNVDVFWASLPSKLLYPMLVLATLATIVASQALISGVFSIIRQAMILGAFPPVRVIHTGGDDLAAATQVYVPLVNFVLFVLCCGVVGGFQNTVALGKAYGLAVMTDMFTTTCLVTLVMLAVWGTSLLFVVPFFCLFFVVEGAYLSANIIKIPGGGWFTLAVALCVSVIMFVWWLGSRRLGERLASLTAGAQIRLVGQPQPPRLLAQTPLPRPATLHTSASLQLPLGRMLSRISSWALSRTGSSTASKAKLDSPSAAGPLSPGRHGGTAMLSPKGSSSTFATSMPTPKLESKSAFTVVAAAHVAAAVAADSQNVPLLDAKAGSKPTALSRLAIPGGPDDSTGAAAAVTPDGAAASGGSGFLTRARLRSKSMALPTPRSQGPPHAGLVELTTTESKAPLPAGTALAAGVYTSQPHPEHGHGRGHAPYPSRQPPGGTGVSVLRQRYRPMPESCFSPGTLALVLPPVEAPTVPLLPMAADQPQEVDPELGDTGLAAAQHPVIVPLKTRLPGIGVYYMEEKIGATSDTLGSLPPVLVHFLGNVQALHEVCVFLSVRRLPIPRVPRRRRLHVYAPHSATPPNFYQVVARYGYLDVIDHGPAFMSGLLDAILRRLTAAAARADHGASPGRPSIGSFASGHLGHMHLHTAHASGVTTDGGGGDVRTDGATGAAGEPNLARFAQHNVALMLRPTAQSTGRPGGYAGVAAEAAAAATAADQRTPGPPPPLVLPMSHRSSTLADGGASGRICSAGDSGEAVGSMYGSVYGFHGVPTRLHAVEEAGVGVVSADGAGSRRACGQESDAPVAATPADKSTLEETLAAFLEAQLHGVVYYASRSVIRADPCTNLWSPSQLVNLLVYGVFFRWLIAISYDDMERWNVPSQNLVELGMHVEI